ncbi:MAG: alpha/beta hydrolase, partial [Abditibacteriales bacterium]|nr:alpha/beta hydrolase [Abditibacteriales bacterium]MDW8367848.1 alpha/beta hydrolase [Abditibacteriales bacterium]
LRQEQLTMHKLRSRITLEIFVLFLLIGVAQALGKAPPPSEKFTVERDVVYRKVDGEELKLDAYVPQGEGKFPAVIVIHGGAWRMGDKAAYAAECIALANNGYAAFTIRYRLLPRHKFPACVEDCKAAVRWVRQNAAKYKVDPQRIGAFGHSAGGHLAAMLATIGGTSQFNDDPNAKPEDSRIQAAVCMAGVFEFPPIDFPLFREFLGGTPQEKPDAYKQASPLHHVSKSTAPILLLHGDEDRFVPLIGSQRFADALTKAGVENQLVVLKGVGHLYQWGHGEAVRQEMVKFFDKHLKRPTPAAAK